MSNNTEEILERLREIRKSLGLSQKEFGERIGMALTSYASIEQGRNSLNERFRKLISHEFGINLNYLDTGEGPVFYDGFEEYLHRRISKSEPFPLATGKSFDSLFFLKDKNQRNIDQRHKLSSKKAIAEERPDFLMNLTSSGLLQEPPEPIIAESKNEIKSHSPGICERCYEKQKLISSLESHISTLEEQLEQKNRIIEYFLTRDGFMDQSSD